MKKFAKKFSIFLCSLFVLSFLAFYMSRIAPGDPLVSYYGERVERMSEQSKDAARERLGLDQPVFIQYGTWLKNAAHGDFGISYKYKQDALTVLKERVGNTLLLGGTGYIIIFLLALLLGIICAAKEDTLLDVIICKVGTITSCIPEFWFSLILILIFSVNLGLLPSSGAYSFGMEDDIMSRITHLILPLAVVVMGHLWYYAYLIRNELVEEVRNDYVLLAKSKGLGKHKIIMHHCVRNIMPSYISLMALSVSHILGGTYVVEMVFSYPGIGTLAFESAKYHDYNMLMLICMLTGAVVIALNMLGEWLAEKVNPQTKWQLKKEEV